MAVAAGNIVSVGVGISTSGTSLGLKHAIGDMAKPAPKTKNFLLVYRFPFSFIIIVKEERDTRIELAYPPWEGGVLPLY